MANNILLGGGGGDMVRYGMVWYHTSPRLENHQRRQAAINHGICSVFVLLSGRRAREAASQKWRARRLFRPNGRRSNREQSTVSIMCENPGHCNLKF